MRIFLDFKGQWVTCRHWRAVQSVVPRICYVEQIFQGTIHINDWPEKAQKARPQAHQAYQVLHALRWRAKYGERRSPTRTYRRRSEARARVRKWPSVRAGPPEILWESASMHHEIGGAIPGEPRISAIRSTLPCSWPPRHAPTGRAGVECVAVCA